MPQRWKYLCMCVCVSVQTYIYSDVKYKHACGTCRHKHDAIYGAALFLRMFFVHFEYACTNTCIRLYDAHKRTHPPSLHHSHTRPMHAVEPGGIHRPDPWVYKCKEGRDYFRWWACVHLFTHVCVYAGMHICTCVQECVLYFFTHVHTRVLWMCVFISMYVCVYLRCYVCRCSDMLCAINRLGCKFK